jgi:prepilin-type N-terminal cleavage/methylation domain-containing protein
MKPSTPKKNNGFTLVELIASLVLAGILAISLTTFVITAVDGFFLSKDAAEISRKAQLALTRIRIELLDASNIKTTESNANKLVFDNEHGTQTVERTTDTVTLNGYILTNGLQESYYAENDFFIYQQSTEGSWSVTIFLKYSGNNTEFQTTVNLRMNTLRNAPKLVNNQMIDNLDKQG